MTARREPSAPPAIPGYVHTGLLGMGGFADVFLYEQQMPRRSVAVKVLLAASLSDAVRDRFRTEADVMARLSHHPSIVTVHHADVARDGRPYLVMENCSRPNLGRRYRTERMGVPEVLRIGIRLGSAVETAHRAGVLHRDIKPANVLITDFGWPALTDFGIAAATGWSAGGAVGMSIPWAPPELLAQEPHGDERSDVYSLAATLYSLLARRSPFEVPGGSNSAADLVARIERSAPAPTGRSDAPESLHAVLARAMDRDPGRRHPSAVAFARALQQVEAELMLPPTPLDLLEEGTGEEPVPPGGDVPAADGDQAGQATRLRPVRTVSADGPVEDPVATAHAGAAGGRSTEVPGEAGPAGGTRSAWSRRLAGVLAGAGLLLAGAVAAQTALQPSQLLTDQVQAPSRPVDVTRAVPSPAGLVGTAAAGSVVFTWENPDPADGDRYLWGLVVPGAPVRLAPVAEPTVAVQPQVPGERVCVEVSIVRADGRYSTQPAVGCAG